MREISHAQEISIKKKYSNESLLYFNSFTLKTKIYSEHVIIYDNFILNLNDGYSLDIHIKHMIQNFVRFTFHCEFELYVS